jgi:hypothetical protein
VVIDGQQRLTTLQVLLDALHLQLYSHGALQPAMRIETLVENPEAFQLNREDRFKVWPTNRDRPAFNEVMGADPPIDYAGLQFAGERLVRAHQYFSSNAAEWLNAGGEDQLGERAEAIERAARELLQLVVIDLTADENAQEIFETLNARGAQLTAADLIKNLIFQRLMEAGAPVEKIYEAYWQDFETAFWETEVGFGRVRYVRSSLYLNHWLIAQTGEEILIRELFSRFKRHIDDNLTSVDTLVAEIHGASDTYRDFIERARTTGDGIDRLGLFAYRISTLESDAFRPAVLLLLDPSLEPVPDHQLTKAINAIESWLVRRMLVRATTKSHTQLVAELVSELRRTNRAAAGDVTEAFLAGQDVQSRYWPDDNELRHELATLQVYKRLRRRRLLMVLEAIEDHKRGWVADREGLGGQRVARGKYHIEHLLPRKWETHWPLEQGDAEIERNRRLDTLGNLTLLTQKLNVKVSNGPWESKVEKLKEHDVLKLNMELLATNPVSWNEESIDGRTEDLVETIIKIWPVPAGHASNFVRATSAAPTHRIGVVDLVEVGLLRAGQEVYPTERKYRGRNPVILLDGRLEIDGRTFNSLSGAAKYIVQGNRNGWSFFSADEAGKVRLNDLWHEYVDMTAAEDAEEPEMSEDLPADLLGTRTQEYDFYVPILSALVQLGGSAPARDVLDAVEQEMRDRFTEEDLRAIPSAPNNPRWDKTANWARQELAEEGYIIRPGRYGIWEISDAGRAWLNEQLGHRGTAASADGISSSEELGRQ